MQLPEQVDIFYFLLIGTLGMLLLSAGLVIFFLFYQRRLLRQEAQMHDIKVAHQEELLFSNIKEIETERKRISTDLHDEIGSLFSTISIKMGQLELTLADTSPEVKKILDENKSLVKLGIQSIKRISHSIIPPSLEFFGLAAALEHLCGQTDSAVLKVTYSAPDNFPEVSAETGLAIYRVAQELLSNAIAHSGATQVDILLQSHTGFILFAYYDNGKGYDTDDPLIKKGLGLRNMESRVNMIKGKLNTSSSPGEGVRVIIEVAI